MMLEEVNRLFSLCPLRAIKHSNTGVAASSSKPLECSLILAKKGNIISLVEEVFKSFTSVKLLIIHCEKAPLQVKVLYSKTLLR